MRRFLGALWKLIEVNSLDIELEVNSPDIELEVDYPDIEQLACDGFRRRDGWDVLALQHLFRMTWCEEDGVDLEVLPHPFKRLFCLFDLNLRGQRPLGPLLRFCRTFRELVGPFLNRASCSKDASSSSALHCGGWRYGDLYLPGSSGVPSSVQPLRYPILGRRGRFLASSARPLSPAESYPCERGSAPACR